LLHFLTSLRKDFISSSPSNWDIRLILKDKFMLSVFIQKEFSEHIEGIVEYSVQEMSDEDMEMLGLQEEEVSDFEKSHFEEEHSDQEVVNQPIIEEEQGQIVPSVEVQKEEKLYEEHKSEYSEEREGEEDMSEIIKVNYDDYDNSNSRNFSKSG
jgi:hypothetical protein